MQALRRATELAPGFEAAQFALATASEMFWRTRPTLEPKVADDLSDLDLDGWPAFFSRGGDVYIEGNQSIYRFDGTTGARIQSYDVIAQGAFSTFDVLGDTLYLDPADYTRREVVEFDANTGKVLKSIPLPDQEKFDSGKVLKSIPLPDQEKFDAIVR